MSNWSRKISERVSKLLCGSVLLLLANFSCLQQLHADEPNANLSNANQSSANQSSANQSNVEQHSALSEIGKPIPIWSSTPPGDEEVELEEEVDVTKDSDRNVAGKRVARLTNVSQPTLTIYRAKQPNTSKSLIVVCPGGGHQVLAWDLEGTEVAEWLNTLGYHAAVLKYRVPTRTPNQRYLAAVQDTQRAISHVRSMAEDLGIAVDRVGVLGFSAGGETAIRATYEKQRLYEPADKIDEQRFRADFGIFIYPAYMVDDTTQRLIEDIVIEPEDPPAFFVHASDDRVTASSSLLLADALVRHQIPCEVHIFQRGGHGYGLRPTKLPVTRWPALCETWLTSLFSND